MRAFLLKVAVGCALVALPLAATAAGASATHARASASLAPPTSCTSPPVTISVDAASGHRPISPLVYGFNGQAGTDFPATSAGGFSTVLAAARPGLVRLGGNRWTAYDWENNASNAGSDYLYENDAYLGSSTTPGAAVGPTVQAVDAAGAATLVTVPIGPYVAADTNGPVAFGSTVDTARFLENHPTGPLAASPDTSDGAVFQNQFVDWLAQTAPGARVLYSLDNEPNDWASTHQEVHPQPVTYAELVNDSVTYAAAIKDTYAAEGLPAPLVTGPALDGWQGQEDAVSGNGASADFQQHGRFVTYYLEAMKAADQAAGHRLVDILDVHWYPQVSPGIFDTGHSPDQVAAREQAPRSLWDPTYTENSWVAQYVGGPIRLIPRLQSEIQAHDPGMGLAITEWNYGGGDDISGGIATADTLGIFGAYGVTAATLWPQFTPHEDWTFGAFEAFRNYDGAGSAFGDTAVATTDSDTEGTSAYGSVDSTDPSRVVIVVVNKSLTTTPATIHVAGAGQTGHAAVYRLTGASPHPQPAPALTATAPGTFSYAMPAQSVSVIVPQPAGAAPDFYAAAPPAAVAGAPYTYTFGATGTPAPTYSVASGSLPPGLSLNAATGVLSGTPSATGTSTFTVQASNGVGPPAVTPALSIAASPGQAPAFSAASPPGAAWDAHYSYAFVAGGNPAPTYEVASGALPDGLCLDPTTGVLSGDTTTVGSSTFTVRASNGIAPAAVTPALTVAVAPPAPGTVLAWGDDAGGQLGPGYRPSASVPAPVPLPAGVSITRIAAGADHSLALTSTGTVYAWGDDNCGQLGNGTDGGCNFDVKQRTPSAVAFPAGTPPVTAIAAGVKHSLALTADGNVWAWGNNGVGELGDGTDSNWRNVPGPVQLGAYGGKVVAIAADGYSSLALTNDGNVLAWGSNVSGALGNGSTAADHVDTPAPVVLGPYAGKIGAIAAGGSQAGHVVALTSAGTVVAWGWNGVGQLGDGTTTDRTEPVPVSAPAGLPSMPPIAAVGAGSYHSFAIAANGAVYAWGDGPFGELGLTTPQVTSTPQQVAPPSGMTALPRLADVTGGDFHSLALTDRGVLYGFGWNGYGQLGDGTTDLRTTATPVSLPPGVVIAAVSSSKNFALALVGPPYVVDVTSGPPDPATSQNATFAFAANESGWALQCRLDGAAWRACSSPLTYHGLSAVPHRFDARAVRAGAVSATTTWRWTIVGPGEPATTITSSAFNPTARTATFSFASDQPGSSFECWTDFAPAWKACSPGLTYHGLPAGSHTFQVHARNFAGQTDSTPATATWVQP